MSARHRIKTKIYIMGVLAATLIFSMAFVACGNPANGNPEGNDPGPGAGDQQSVTIGGVAFALRYVPGGTFMIDMGDNAKPPTPNHNMTISKGYWMGETEVTQGLFETVMGVKPSSFTTNPEDGGADGWKKLPVDNISWYDAITFCNKLSLLDGKTPVYSVTVSSVEVGWASLAYGAIPTTNNTDWNVATINPGATGYRLPTEMEWMWAAMGASKGGPASTGYTKGYAGSLGSGQTNIGDYAWYTANSSNMTHEVGSKTANELGIKDMSGNVYEWCGDWYADSYPAGTVSDFMGADSGSNRVLRGGSWDNDATYYPVARRLGAVLMLRKNTWGIRVVQP
jgi:formylglycine-generating enzyme required for sulfatase activity